MAARTCVGVPVWTGLLDPELTTAVVVGAGQDGCGFARRHGPIRTRAGRFEPGATARYSADGLVHDRSGAPAWSPPWPVLSWRTRVGYSGRASCHGQPQATGSIIAQVAQCRLGGHAGGQPVVDEDHVAPPELGEWPVAAVEEDPPLEVAPGSVPARLAGYRVASGRPCRSAPGQPQLPVHVPCGLANGAVTIADRLHLSLRYRHPPAPHRCRRPRRRAPRRPYRTSSP